MTTASTPEAALQGTAGTTVAGSPGERSKIQARVGDRLFIPSPHPGASVRSGLILQVRRMDGRPPYRVRWSDTGHESLVFPGPEARVHRYVWDPETS